MSDAAGFEQLRRRGEIVGEAKRAIIQSNGELNVVANWIARIYREEAYKQWLDPVREEVYESETLGEFIVKPMPGGLGLTFDLVRDMCRIDPEVERIVLQEIPAAAANGEYGNGRSRSDIIRPTHGTAETYTLSRLKRDRKDLFDRVIDGEMSANAAAIEAGFREKKVTVPAGLFGLARWIKSHYDKDQIEDLISALREG